MVMALIRAASANSKPGECPSSTPKPHFRRQSSARQRRTTQKRLESKLPREAAGTRHPCAAARRPRSSVLRAASRAHDAVRKRRSPEVNRRRCGVALQGSSRSVMEEQVPSVKRGDWVLVDDVAVFEGRVVVVIGVTAVIRVPRMYAAGDTYRAAEVRCCRPWLEEMVAESRRSPEPAPAGPRNFRRVMRGRERA
jgi:putative transposon-encoded protein